MQFFILWMFVCARMIFFIFLILLFAGRWRNWIHTCETASRATPSRGSWSLGGNSSCVRVKAGNTFNWQGHLKDVTTTTNPFGLENLEKIDCESSICCNWAYLETCTVCGWCSIISFVRRNHLNNYTTGDLSRCCKLISGKLHKSLKQEGRRLFATFIV